MWKILFLAFAFVLTCHAIEGRNPSKHVLKVIKTNDGDIFHCIDINRQPAFDNPLLKNHKIQIMPSFFRQGGDATISRENLFQPNPDDIGLEKIDCPRGTVPIHRTMNEGKLIYTRKNEGQLNAITNRISGHFAGAVTYTKSFHGGRARFNVWNPQVLGNQSTFMTMILEGWDGDDVLNNTNFVQAGWVVDPLNFKDTKTRLYASWTRDGLGFIQTNPSYAVGSTVWPVSTYNGKQYDLTLLLRQDAKTRNWWLCYGPDNVPIGYWPKKLFTNLAKEAKNVAWTAYTMNGAPMGSGHSAYEGFGKASYIRQMEVVNDQYAIEGVNIHSVRLSYDAFKCYPVVVDKSQSTSFGIFVGGPGNCES